MRVIQKQSASTNLAARGGNLGVPLVTPSGDPFQVFLMSLRQLTGAATASLLIGAESERESSVLLLHEGVVAPVPELKAKTDALDFVAGIDVSLRESQLSSQNRAEQSPVHLYRSVVNYGCLLRISIGQFLSKLKEEQSAAFFEQRRNSEIDPAEEIEEDVWIGLSFVSGELPSVLQTLQSHPHSHPDQRWGRSGNTLESTLALGSYMAWQTYQISSLLRDPASLLPGRAEFQAHLKFSFKEARRKKQALALILINPDDFGVINQRFDHEKGDLALSQIAEKLRSDLRRSDALFRYGGAVFGAVIPGVDKHLADQIAKKISHTLTGNYLDGEVRLSFSLGIAVYKAGEEEDLEADENDLLRKSDHALNLAKRAGGGRTVLWEPGGTDSELVSLDRLSGIFTADTEKDYRNMLLLWDTIAVVSSILEKEIIAKEFVDRVRSTLKPNRVALFIDGDEKGPLLLASSCSDDVEYKRKEDKPGFVLSDKQRELLSQTREGRRIERLRFSGSHWDHDQSGKNGSIAYAVPLVAREEYMGCLYVDGPEEGFSLDSSDQIFLNALAGQVALTLDRAELVQRRKKEQERDSQKLREEVRELREVLHSAKLVYCSEKMQLVLDTLRAVAPMDVTVLITGESGTGKEMLARALHEQSDSKSQSLITVDCSTIAHNLMEAELFGHVKGAYTGADGSAEGRIAQAEGGTLFLDEIGEVPLDVQVKLLRFVQEKEFTPVGGMRSRRVDVRIVAATNRDLLQEVAEGRFREDLYYRLNVVTVTAPPLRDRPDDILPLARHFVEKFALQYQKGVRRLSADAEAALLAYHFPGNVRELQNSILRTVVLSVTEMIDSDELQLVSKESRPAVSAEPQYAINIESQPMQNSPLVAEVATAHQGGDWENDDVQLPGTLENSWQELHLGLERLVISTIEGCGAAPVPLGRWLTEDLVREADKAGSGVARRASQLLGVAETTYRRQFEKTRRAELSGLLVRTPSWSALLPILSRLVALAGSAPGRNVIDEAREMLLREVVTRVGSNSRLGSALMGVTVPTYQRWIQLK